MAVITVTRVNWVRGEKVEVPYQIEVQEIDQVREFDLIMLYTKKSAWHKHEDGIGISIKESLKELENLAGKEAIYIRNIFIEKYKSKKTHDYDDYNEYGAEPDYDRDSMWEELSEEGIYEE